MIDLFNSGKTNNSRAIIKCELFLSSLFTNRGPKRLLKLALHFIANSYASCCTLGHMGEFHTQLGKRAAHAIQDQSSYIPTLYGYW